MYKYLIINGVYDNNYLIDRNKLRILQYSDCDNIIEDITKEILSYYNKVNKVGYYIFKAFVVGNYSGYDLVVKSNKLEDLKLPFNLEIYYQIYNKLSAKEKKKYILRYDKDNNQKFLFNIKEG